MRSGGHYPMLFLRGIRIWNQTWPKPTKQIKFSNVMFPGTFSLGLGGAFQQRFGQQMGYG